MKRTTILLGIQPVVGLVCVLAACVAVRAADASRGSTGGGAAPTTALAESGRTESALLHKRFVRDVYLPFLLREAAEPLERDEAALSAPWREDALEAIRGWLAQTARGEFRTDARTLSRAVSAEAGGCAWPAVRYLAARLRFEAELRNPEGEAARKMHDAVRAARFHPLTTPAARFLLLRDLDMRSGTEETAKEESDAFAALASSRGWDGENARVLWWLRRNGASWSDDALTESIWGEGAKESAGAATNAWLREMMLGAEARRNAWRAAEKDPGSTEDPRSAFGRELERARGHFARASELEPGLPEGPWQMVGVLHGDPTEARRWFDETVRREFDCPGVREQMLWGLRPRWGGSVEAMLAFGDECYETGRFDTDVPAFWAVARFAAASELGDRWEAAFRGAETLARANRIADAILEDPEASSRSRIDALYLKIWPCWANDDAGLEEACDRYLRQCPPYYFPAVNFDGEHPMFLFAAGFINGIDSRHGRTVVGAMRAWRSQTDIAGAKAALEAIARDGTSNPWERSFASGAAAMIGAELSSKTGVSYSLSPEGGTSGRRMFWQSWDSRVLFGEGGWTAGRTAGEMRTAFPVLPASFALDIGVCAAATNDPCVRFHLAVDADFDAREPVRTLLAERSEQGWTLGWARIRRVDPDINGNEAFSFDGERIALAPDEGGAARFVFRVENGSVRVFANGKERKELAIANAISHKPHRFGVAGRNFVLFEADARAVSDRD